MSGKLGSTNMWDIYKQSSIIDSIYLGTTKVYDINDKNKYVITVPAGMFVALQSDLRGRPTAGKTNWGDGTIDTNTSHTYTTAGTYTITTKYAFTNYIGYSAETNGFTNYIYNNISAITGITAKINNYTNLFAWHESVQGSPQQNFKNNFAHATNISGMFSYCRNITGAPVCSDKVVDFSKTYEGCSNLTGSPLCGKNVTNMWSSYQ